jgi:virginiamycin B lyase
MPRSTLTILLSSLLIAVSSGTAEGYVYWSEGGSAGSIARANLLGGLEPGRGWIPAVEDGCGVGLDAEHVYWTTRDGQIGRANLDGTDVERNFIVLPDGWACGVAVDSSHVYWASNSSGKLGRAALDGSEVQPSWMSPGAGHGCGIAVSATTVFWATTTGVYRSPLSGGRPVPVTTATTENCGVAINAVHVYWATGNGYIERDLLSGGPPTPVVKAPLGPCGVAVDSRHLYWGNSQSDSIGRANLDGSSANSRFAVGAQDPCGVAADALGPSPGSETAPPGGGSGAAKSNDFHFGDLRKNRSRGTARLELVLPASGTVTLVGRRIVRREVTVRREASPSSPIAIHLLISPKPGTRRILRARGTAGVFLAVSFTPSGGRPRTRYTGIRLALDRNHKQRGGE